MKHGFRYRIACVLAVPFMVSGCGFCLPVACGGVSVPAVKVSVFDSKTGASANENATAVLIEGSYRETMSPDISTGEGVSITTGFSGGLARPGTYTVHVSKQGYIDWEREGVRVTQGECYPNTVILRADLQPLP